MTSLKESALNTAPEYYHQYINLAPNLPILDIIEDGGLENFIHSFEELNEIGNKVYAPGKWTVKELVQHLIDTERIFVNRALRFARNDKTDLPGYDHDSFAPVSRANEQSLEDLLKEYRILRLSTYYFFKNMNEEQLLSVGKANGLEISVAAIGYILVGHPTHHFNVIKEKYFSL